MNIKLLLLIFRAIIFIVETTGSILSGDHDSERAELLSELIEVELNGLLSNLSKLNNDFNPVIIKDFIFEYIDQTYPLKEQK